ncbi:MAG: hypothetical protein GTN89_08165 [Acidobacteria bacterium]|nr:hypothetical protein [Acidobacteriota bacterium]NIM63748.1 hypothetical protein [Acidobacteriota bacterium]NIO59317.1 hypothetical protein [Acidobacteriota bacterium]NIQ30331.1 hypothetical protein [Acidobacteriota bacterium]NIQ85268.1 hypothetical protein [Acidobacteriota bacterium]
MRRLLWLCLLLPAGLLLGQDEEPRIHDPELDELAVSIYSKFLAEDYETIRADLRKLRDACSEMKVEERERYGSLVLDYDRSFHRALDRVRALAARGEWDDSGIQYEWVMRSCVGCHRASREAGFGPPVPVP